MAEGSVKTGLSHQEKITQKKPQKTDEMTQRPLPTTEKVSSEKPGNFKLKY